MGQIFSHSEHLQEEKKLAREQMILENMGLVYSVARRFVGRGQEMEDLIQLGTIGLCKAVDRFDNTFEVKFSTYAVPLIAGEIRRFLRDDGRIKVSRGVKEDAYKIAKAEDEIRQETNGEVTISKLTERTGLTAEQIFVAKEAAKEVGYLDEPCFTSDGNEISLKEVLPSKENLAGMVVNHVALEFAMQELTQEERRVIELRFFREYSQSKVAMILERNQVWVSRVEKRVLMKMREQLRD